MVLYPTTPIYWLPLTAFFIVFSIHYANAVPPVSVAGPPQPEPKSKLHQSLMADSYSWRLNLHSSHWNTCDKDLKKYSFERISRGTYGTVFEVTDPDSQGKMIVKAQVLGVRGNQDWLCISEVCQYVINPSTPKSRERPKRARTMESSSFLVPNEVAAGLMLNNLDSPIWTKTKDWTFCDAQDVLLQTEMPKDFTTRLKPQYDLLSNVFRVKPFVLTLYIMTERINPGQNLTVVLASQRLRDWVVRDETGEVGYNMTRKIFTQLFASLYEAQQKYQFTHYDLHTHNVLLAHQPADGPLIFGHGEFKFKDVGLPWTLKIIDYGLSSIVDPNTRLQFSSPLFPNFRGFRPAYDAALFTCYFLDWIDWKLLRHIRLSVPRKRWIAFANMLEFAVGREVIHYYLAGIENFDAKLRNGDWVFDFIREMRASTDLRSELDRILLRQVRNVDHMEDLLSFNFFDDLRI